MAVIGGSPFKITDATLMLGADNYEALISSAELVPTSTSSTFKAIDGSNYTFAGKSAWVLNITFAQDWVTPGSLSNKLFADEGITVNAVVTPLDGGPGFSVDVTLVAPNVGGAADADAVSSVTLGVNGKPVIIPAAA